MDNLNIRHSDISPAVSPIPESDRRQSQSSFCVSPIGDGDGLPRVQQENQPSSSPSIPNAQNFNNQPRSQLQPVQPVQEPRRFISGRPTRWDDFSGEPTSGHTGNVTPPEFRDNDKTAGAHSGIMNWTQQFNPKKTLNSARNRISSLSKTDDPSQRQPRSRSTSRVLPLEEHSSNRKRVPDKSPQLDEFSFAPSVVTTITAGGPVPPPPRLTLEPVCSPQETNPGLQIESEATHSLFPSEEPMSRFSATTYTSTEPGSQDASPRESMQLENRSTDDVSTSSIMDRRRPIPSGMPTSKKQPASTKPVRKPTPSQVAEQAAQMPVQSSPAPEVPLDAQGRIEVMEAKRGELSQRRSTLETVILELSNAIRPTSTMYDLAAKAEVQKSIKSMEGEIADIKKDEHELGMKITRAWRRLDEKENAGDGTNLWVKRVTS